MAKIKKVTVILGAGKTKEYEVGYNNIHHIDDRSLEYETSYHLMLLCNDCNDNLIHSIEDLPVIIDYDKVNLI